MTLKDIHPRIMKWRILVISKCPGAAHLISLCPSRSLSLCDWQWCGSDGLKSLKLCHASPWSPSLPWWLRRDSRSEIWRPIGRRIQISHLTLEIQDLAAMSANKAGRRTVPTATSGAPTRWAGLMPKISARRRVLIWPQSPQAPSMTTYWRGRP